MMVQRWRVAAVLAVVMGAGAGWAAVPTEVKVVVEAERAEYLVGEPVLLKFGVTNVTDKAIKINAGGDYRGGTRAGRFIVTATDEKGVAAIDPDPVQVEMGGIGGDVEILPGGTKWMPVSPLRYCLIDKAGTYKISVGHDLGLLGDRMARRRQATDFPTAEITLKFKTPDEGQARKLVDDLMAMPERSMPMIDGKRPDADLRRDFATLRLAVYLKPLVKYAEAGHAEAVAGIGSIETPEATEALIDLLKNPSPKVAEAVSWPLDQRLPRNKDALNRDYFRREDKTGRYAALVKATWRPEFAVDLRVYAVAELKQPKGETGETYFDKLGHVAEYLELIGEKEDAPAVYDALDEAATRVDRGNWPVEAVMDPRNVWPMTTAAQALIARGAAPPDGKRISAVVLELQKIRQDKTYRPAGWQAALTDDLSDSRIYIRQLALQTLVEIPEPMPEPAKTKLGELLGDGDPVVRLAAIQAVGKSGDRALGLMVLEMGKTSSDKGVLYQVGYAMAGLPLKVEWLEVCAGRLNEEGQWNVFFPPLLRTLADLDGSGTSGQPKGEDLDRAQELWKAFIAKHREELAAGKKIPLAETDAGMAPAPAKYSRVGGGVWPVR